MNMLLCYQLGSRKVSLFLLAIEVYCYLKLSWSEYLYVFLASNIFSSHSGYNWTVLLCWSQACKWDNWDYNGRACSQSKTGCSFFMMLFICQMISFFLSFFPLFLACKKKIEYHTWGCCILFITYLGCC